MANRYASFSVQELSLFAVSSPCYDSEDKANMSTDEVDESERNPMYKQELIRELKLSKEYLDRSSKCLEEADADYSPVDGVFTARQQIAHIAATVDWFLEGAFGGGFDMDFDSHTAVLDRAKSLGEARQWVERSYAKAVENLESKTAEELNEPLPEGPVMSGQPRRDIFWASGYPLYSSCPDGGTIALIYQLLVGRQMPIGCLGAVCFTANLWLKRQNHPESPAKSTGTNAGSRPDMSVRITRVKWITRFWAIMEHTAHHRGALTVYSRLRGHVPAMPYM